MFCNRDEHGRWEGEVKEAVGFAAVVVLLDGLEVLCQILEGGTVLIAARNIRGEFLKLFDFSSDLWIVIRILDVGCGAFVILLLVHLCPGVTDDMDIPREITVTVETKQSWVGLSRVNIMQGAARRDEMANLFLCEVTGCTKD